VRISLQLLPLLFFLSFFRLSVEGLGAFILIDGVSLLYFLICPGRLVAFLGHLRYLLIGVVGAVVALVVTGANEFPFIVRLGLVVFDACFLASVSASTHAVVSTQKMGLVIRQALLGYLAAATIWLLLPEGSDAIFYLDAPKAWVATFPALLIVYFLLLKSYKSAIVAGLCIMAVSLHPEIASRTLFLQSLLLTFYGVWKLNRKLALLSVALVVGVGLLASSLRTSLVDDQEHSNTFRLVMTTQILDFSPLEWLLGRGIEPWRARAFEALFDLPGADVFFESANPHFFPAELIIRGGLFFFLSAALLLYSVLRHSPYRWIALFMLFGTFMTTNTGVERLYITLALSVSLGCRRLIRSSTASTQVPQPVGCAPTAP
jgi:hypothetical protein